MDAKANDSRLQFLIGHSVNPMAANLAEATSRRQWRSAESHGEPLTAKNLGC